MRTGGWAAAAAIALAIVGCGGGGDHPIGAGTPTGGAGSGSGGTPPGGGGTTPGSGGTTPGGGGTTPGAGGTTSAGGSGSGGGAGPGGGRGAPLAATYTEGKVRFFAVGADGTSYGQRLDDAPDQLYASADGRTWTLRAAQPTGRVFFLVIPLRSGALLADTIGADGSHAISRSSDGGRTWSVVLPLGKYRLLTPASVAELGGEVFAIEYQAFTGQSVPIRLWASDDDGRTWSVRNVTTTHRHGHGLLADPAAGALWTFYGDLQGGTYLSLDGGRTMTLVRGPLDGGVLVMAVPTAQGLLGGLDTLWQALPPNVVTLSFGGAYAQHFQLPGPSYSIRALDGGGYLVGAAREPTGDVYPDASAHLFASPDGVSFREVFSCPQLDPTATARADVYFQLPTGEAVVQVVNCAGFGAGGLGYVLLSPP
ncbi:WD40/YVTN/BNR-like repeat-containing protein [Anaeromyxobacter oryzae]|uniref:Exo-alpha-sialidase n=1 Tax=Anaeromyxobacter oryzae TaxID=2918170 RepID=A0ABN6MVE4_9BACT|nr:sialidase family protein [Anaeromyxobacter oryzae]BDG04880.1 hypothetical protein AMOR_38760 [Anaeromyxobacter oryzae]